jgi:hypothetical protein
MEYARTATPVEEIYYCTYLQEQQKKKSVAVI